MPVNLTGYRTIQTNLFVRIDVNNSGSEIWRFSDYESSFNILGEEYLPLGQLLGIGRTKSEITPTTNPISITISGIPNTEIAEVLSAKLKGSSVKIFRAFFETDTGVLVGTVANRFVGKLKSYAIDEVYDVPTRTASNTIALNIDSTVSVYAKKTSGRTTNPQSLKSFYPGNPSFNRVPTLKGEFWDFGEVK